MKNVFAALALAACAASSHAVVITLTFEGTTAPFADPTGFGAGIDSPANYYNGGTTLGGLGPGPAWGVEFVSQSLTILDGDIPGATGNIGREPSPSTVLFFLGDAGSAAVMNVNGGFDTGFATHYSSINRTGQVRVWDGLNATGNVLATIPLLPLGTDPNGGDPSGAYNIWALVGAQFAGTAYSVSFEGAPNFIAFDDVVFGSDVPAPGVLAILGLGGIAAGRRRR